MLMKKFSPIKNIKTNINDIKGNILKNNETYIVQDNPLLNNLVLSSTTLHPNKHTSGHKHEGQEEIYFFIKGEGKMEISQTEDTTEVFEVKTGDVIQIEDGAFHKVYNTSSTEDLYFVCVFDGKRNH